MREIFTDPTIRNLKPAQGSDYVCMAVGEPGFGIRVYPGGSMTFFFQYKMNSQRRTMALGNYVTASKKGGEQSLKVARELYQAELSKVKALRRGSADGVDPVAEIKRKQEQRIADEAARSQSLTVSELCNEYIEKHAKQFKRSWLEDERILHKEILNEEKKKGSTIWSKRSEKGATDWSKRKAQDITKRDVVLLLEKIIERGSPGMSNNTFQVVRKMLNFAVERDILPFSPATGVKALAPKVVRDRALSSDEIKALWNNLHIAAISNEIIDALKLMLITAQRPGEVIGLHTREIDGDWWTIPIERSKNGKSHRVFLTPSAKEIVSQAIARVGLTREVPSGTQYNGFIFPCPHKNKEQSIDVHAVAIAVHRNLSWPLLDKKGKPLLDKEGKFVIENRLEIDHFTPHDLRRTAATFMAQAGEMDEVIDAVLNHAKQGVIKVYNQYRYDIEKQKALETWERKLNSIITSTENNVIDINRGRKIAA